MICDKCKNRTICKYYSFLLDAPMDYAINSCEKYIANKVEEQPRDNNLLRFKQPIDYKQIDNTNDELNLYDNEEERIEVDLSEENHNNVLSITDILMGKEEEDNGEKN